jgi:putative spermidine/putrescine transport system permease protein
MTPRRSPLLYPLLAVLVASAIIPLLLLAAGSLARGWFWPALLPGGWDAESWTRLADGRGRLARAALTSAVLGLATAALGTALALPAGRALARLRGWRRHVGAAAAFLPVAAPPIALGTGLQVSFLALGLGGTFAGVLLAHLVPAVGYLSLYFLGVFAVWDARVEDEARSLGASPRQVLLRVTLPLLRPALATAAALGFLVSWAQVPLTLLAGRGLVATLPLEVLGYVQAGQDRYAATGALLLVLPPLAAMAVARAAARRAEVAPA